MWSEIVEVLVLVVRIALFLGLCWGAGLCVSERIAQARPANIPPLERFATFAALVLLLTAVGAMAHAR